MAFMIDPKWNHRELELHQERYDLLVKMNEVHSSDKELYLRLAKRYHEINEILGDDKC